MHLLRSLLTPPFSEWGTNYEGDCIATAVINTNAKLPVLLWGKDNCGDPFPLGKLNDVLLEHLVHFSSFDGSCFRLCAARCAMDRSYARTREFDEMSRCNGVPKRPYYISWNSFIIVKNAFQCELDCLWILISSCYISCGESSSFFCCSSSFT